MPSNEYAIAKLQARMDAINCTAGNKPCGNRCIPFKHECKVESGGKKGHDPLHKRNGDFLYHAYGFEKASHDMAKLNPRMGLNNAHQYHREMSYAIAKNMDGDPNKDIAKINKKYQPHFGK